MARLFFLLSGEHPSLPFSELESIIAAESYEYQVLERLTQVLRVETDINSIKVIEFRSALTQVCGLELFTCDAVLTKIVKELQSVSLDDFLRSGESFAVRIRRIQRAAPHIIRIELERKLGELILDKVKGAKVNLKSPQKTFFGIVTENRFIFGLKVAEIPTKPLFERSPQKRPFFHPSAMLPKLARCMVNLAQPRNGDLILDPFCGTASMLIEAGLMGYRVVGLDVQSSMVRGSLRNFLHLGVKAEGMVVADAEHLPMSRIDCVVTDPPYGRSATTLGRTTRSIVESFLSNVGKVLPKGRRICIAAPKSVEISGMAKGLGFKHVESHLVYVHRSLTREIAVLEKKA